MNFKNKMFYLVDTHQAKNTSDAAKMITKMTNDKVRAHLREALKGQMWYLKEA